MDDGAMRCVMEERMEEEGMVITVLWFQPLLICVMASGFSH